MLQTVAVSIALVSSSPVPQKEFVPDEFIILTTEKHMPVCAPSSLALTAAFASRSVPFAC